MPRPKRRDPIRRGPRAMLAAVMLASISGLPAAAGEQGLAKGDCDNPRPVTDLTHCSFAGRVMLGADLHGADLTRVDLSNAKLAGCDLIGATLRGANLKRADLSS